MQDEESLVQRAMQYDQQAFAQLYEAHFDRIYRYVAFKIGDRTEAEDMTQQVFLNAIKSISSFKWKKGTPFSAWLYRIAHNQIVDYFRKKTKFPTVSIVDSVVDRDPALHLLVEQKLEVEQLTLAANKLTRAQREVISLRFAAELSIAEVALIMGKSQGAVKALQHSAIVALRKVLLVGNNNEEVQRI